MVRMDICRVLDDRRLARRQREAEEVNTTCKAFMTNPSIGFYLGERFELLVFNLIDLLHNVCSRSYLF
jgi:hypothetical protein